MHKWEGAVGKEGVINCIIFFFASEHIIFDTGETQHLINDAKTDISENEVQFWGPKSFLAPYSFNFRCVKNEARPPSIRLIGFLAI